MEFKSCFSFEVDRLIKYLVHSCFKMSCSNLVFFTEIKKLDSLYYISNIDNLHDMNNSTPTGNAISVYGIHQSL